jgi:hypothetical protein
MKFLERRDGAAYRKYLLDVPELFTDTTSKHPALGKG